MRYQPHEHGQRDRNVNIVSNHTVSSYSKTDVTIQLLKNNNNSHFSPISLSQKNAVILLVLLNIFRPSRNLQDGRTWFLTRASSWRGGWGRPNVSRLVHLAYTYSAALLQPRLLQTCQSMRREIIKQEQIWGKQPTVRIVTQTWIEYQKCNETTAEEEVVELRTRTPPDTVYSEAFTAQPCLAQPLTKHPTFSCCQGNHFSGLQEEKKTHSYIPGNLDTWA